MASRSILLKLIADVDPLKRGLREAGSEVKGFSHVKGSASVDVLLARGAQARLDRLNTRLEALKKQPHSATVDIRTAATIKQIQRVNKELEGTQTRGRRVGESLRRVAGAAAGLGVGFAAFAGAKQAVDTTEELAHATLQLHKNLGLDIQTSSEWAAVAKARNIDQKQLAQSFGTLSKNILAGQQGGKAQIKLFHELGISIADLKRQDFNTTIGQVSDGLHRLGAGAPRTAIAMRLFGRSWQGINPVLREGSASMREQLALAEKYGVTFKGHTVKSLEELIQAQREAKFATTGLQVAFGTELAPVLTRVLHRLSDFVRGMRDGTGAGGRFARALRPIVAALRAIIGFLLRHPHALSVALGAWLAYRVGALKALGLVRSALRRLFTGQAERAAVAGETAGTRFGRAFGPAAAVLIGAYLANYLQSLKWFRNLEQKIADKITGGHGITDAQLNKTEDGLRRSIKRTQQTRPLGGPLADALATLPGNQPARKHATTIPPVGADAEIRALRLALNQAERTYRDAVRRQGANSAAAIRAAADVASARQSLTSAEHPTTTTRRRRRGPAPPEVETPTTLLQIRVVERQRRLQDVIERFGSNSRQARRERGEIAVANARDTVRTDRQGLATAIRKFGEHSEKAARARLLLITAQTRLREASDKLKGSLDKNVKACGGQLFPKPTDIARPVSSGAAAHLARRGALDILAGGGDPRGVLQQHFHGDLVMPKTVAPIGDPQYDATKLHRHLRALGAALPT